MSFFDNATSVDASRSTFMQVNGDINHHEYHIYVAGPTDSAALAKRLSESTTPSTRIVMHDFSTQSGTEKLQGIFTISRDNQLHATQCLQRLADILYQKKETKPWPASEWHWMIF